MKELLYSLDKRDFNVTFFRGSGAGGQHRNKTDSACRIQHPASGAVAESQQQRSQHQNKKIAFRRLLKTVKFKLWHTRKVNELISGQTVEEKVEKAMQLDNLKIECKQDGKWVTTPANSQGGEDENN